MQVSFDQNRFYLLPNLELRRCATFRQGMER